jgi:hypothetical protein
MDLRERAVVVKCTYQKDSTLHQKRRLTFVVMQAITVLLLELAQGAIHWPTDPSNIATCVEKLTRWLKAMKSNDVVSERAYNVVCKMLGKYEQSREDVATGQWAAEMAEQPYNEPTAAFYMDSQPYNDLDLQYLQETLCLDTCSNDDYYPQANSGNFDLNSLAWPLNEPLQTFSSTRQSYRCSLGIIP